MKMDLKTGRIGTLRTSRVRIVALVTLCVAMGGAFVAARMAAAQAASSTSPQPMSAIPTIPPAPLAPAAKQALINSINARRTQLNPNGVVAPDPAAYQSVSPSMIEATNQPCTRDLSELVSGLNGPLNDLDFPEYKSYRFNNEWIDPDGSQAVMVGDLNGEQGAIAVEVWSPPTHCAPTSHALYLAPANSGSLTITSLSGSTVSLSSTTGTAWTFDLATDVLSEVH